MFSGEETILPMVTDRATTLDWCARAMMEVWKQAVIQDAGTGEIFADYAHVPFTRMKEMMIYRDEETLRSWDELGADETNRNTMVHFVFASEGMVSGAG